MVDTGKLNTNDNQESEHKAHLRQNYNGCLTAQHYDSAMGGVCEVTKKGDVTCE